MEERVWAVREDLFSEILSIEVLERIDQVCLDFEAAWKRGGKPPRIEDYVGIARDEEERWRLLYELLALELVYRRGRNESPAPAEYRARFDADGAVIDAAFTEGGGSLRRIGRYHVIAKLNGGGQADVYRALHAGLDRELVIKLGHDRGNMDRASSERFLEEGKILAELRHPHLARVYDVDFFEGRPFLAMEYVRGRNLAQELRARTLQPRKAATLLAKVARALDAAHCHGVVHRDIKPENIIIDETGEPRVLDFGLSGREDAWRTHGMDGGSLGGTVAYMPPEQARGEAERVDARSDVFAVGAVLYRVLVGKAPYTGNDESEVLERARLCDFDQAALNRPGVPGRLRRICLKAMAADKAERHESAPALARDLERYVRAPILRLWVAGGAIAVALVLVGAFVLPGLLHPSAPVDDLRVEMCTVAHYSGTSATYIGTIGDTSRSAAFDDDLRVRFRLNRPAYCYLIAFNPDGREQLCHPEDESEQPQLVSSMTYPPGGEYFGLTDGTGLQVFVLVASKEPLPPYRDWRAALGNPPWRVTREDEIEEDVVWRYEDGSLSGFAAPLRGDVRSRLKPPRPLLDLCDFFRNGARATALHALAFKVTAQNAPEDR
jgi:tRNA A-37 threonylcarbamoyl transferase component Bud32